MKKFIIKLKEAHDATGLTPYAVSKQVKGVSYNTVRKYASHDEVEAATIPVEVILLADFYGLDWRDPDVIEVIEEAPGDEQGQSETPLAAAG